VLVLAMFALALLLVWLPLGGGKWVLLFVAGTLLAALLANWLVQPPGVKIYDDFRTPAYTDVDWRIMPLVPYAPTDYLRDYPEHGLEAPLKATGRFHLMGTEENGADVFSRMIHASRIALSIGLIATGIAMVIGVILGGLMGYFSGVVDMIGMRLVEIFEAIPTLFLLLTFVAFFGRSLYMMMVIIGITSWSGYARYIRAEFLKLRKQEYVQAAVASGLPLTSILFRHMLPNGVAPLLVAVSFGVASAILAEATLSFLGLGLVGEPSWGQMLDQAVKSSSFNWWMAAFPGGAIFLTVFAYNLIGEAFRDAIDPKLSRNAGVGA
jgi:peptide/nickel transport system permease protein